VKDLTDLVLLIDDGLEPSWEPLDVVRRVFSSRATHDLPLDVADPPAEWAGRYAEPAADLNISAVTVDQAMRTLRAFVLIVRSYEE
jgi:hypothetical protein